MVVALQGPETFFRCWQRSKNPFT